MVLQKMVLKINHCSSGKLIIAQWALALIRKGLSQHKNKSSIFFSIALRDLSLILFYMLKFKNEKKLQDRHFFQFLPLFVLNTETILLYSMKNA